MPKMPPCLLCPTCWVFGERAHHKTITVKTDILIARVLQSAQVPAGPGGRGAGQFLQPWWGRQMTKLVAGIPRLCAVEGIVCRSSHPVCDWCQLGRVGGEDLGGDREGQ
jgi:hypothetical protein